MLYRTGIKLTLALIVALIAVVARAGGGDPRLPPWPYENDPRFPVGMVWMDCNILNWHPAPSELSDQQNRSVFPITKENVPQQWCDNHWVAKKREPNCVRSVCRQRLSCLMCVVIGDDNTSPD